MQIGRRDDVPGYRSFKVLKTEIDSLAGDQPHIRRRAEMLPKGQLASALAAAIGIKSRGWYPGLFEAGHVDACWVHHPVTGKAVLYVTETHVAAFHRRFLTLRMMRKEFGLQYQLCITRLRAARVTPFAPAGQDFGPIYERRDVEQVLIAARSCRRGRP